MSFLGNIFQPTNDVNSKGKWYLHQRLHRSWDWRCIITFLQKSLHFCRYLLINGNNAKHFGSYFHLTIGLMVDYEIQSQQKYISQFNIRVYFAGEIMCILYRFSAISCYWTKKTISPCFVYSTVDHDHVSNLLCFTF